MVKQWFEIIAPKHFKEKLLGETAANEGGSLIGRVVDVSAPEVGADPSKYYIKLFFRIDTVNGSKALTKWVGHDCTRDFISRIVAYRSVRIDTDDLIELKDCKVMVKSITVTFGRASGKTAKTIRRDVKSLIAESLKGMSSDEFVAALMDGKMQYEIKDKLHKIFPMRCFEFRKTQIL